MNDKIRLGNSGHEPSNEERVQEDLVKGQFLRKAAEKPIRHFYVIDVHGLFENGLVIHRYADSEPRNSDNPMRITLADGVTQGEFLYYWSEVREEATNDWDRFTSGGGGGRPTKPPEDRGERRRRHTA